MGAQLAAGRGVMHTPGPWDAQGIYFFADPLVGETIPLGEMNYKFISFDEAKANARLIAAAPELLASCKELRDALAAAMRVIATSECVFAGAFADELAEAAVPSGFGVRAQFAIAKAEGK